MKAEDIAALTERAREFAKLEQARATFRHESSVALVDALAHAWAVGYAAALDDASSANRRRTVKK